MQAEQGRYRAPWRLPSETALRVIMLTVWEGAARAKSFLREVIG
jgi:hypothetical protein